MSWVATPTGALVDELTLGHEPRGGRELRPVPAHVRDAWSEEFPAVEPFEPWKPSWPLDAADLTDDQVRELGARVLEFLGAWERAQQTVAA